MNIEILDEMTEDELIEYCVALNDCLYNIDKVSDLRNDINRAQTILAEYNESLSERLVEQTLAVNRLEAMEANLTDTYRGHIKPAKIKPYRKSDKLDVEVMDLDNDKETDKKPEPKYGPGDIVWVNGLMGRHIIIGINGEYTSKTGNFVYDITPFDNHKDAYTLHAEESRILELDNRED
jgi:hypothetical protein